MDMSTDLSRWLRMRLVEIDARLLDLKVRLSKGVN